MKDHIWFIDNFGNAKTTILPEDIGYEEGKELQLVGGHDAARQLADRYRDVDPAPYDSRAPRLPSTATATQDDSHRSRQSITAPRSQLHIAGGHRA